MTFSNVFTGPLPTCSYRASAPNPARLDPSTPDPVQVGSNPNRSSPLSALAGTILRSRLYSIVKSQDSGSLSSFPPPFYTPMAPIATSAPLHSIPASIRSRSVSPSSMRSVSACLLVGIFLWKKQLASAFP
jgi:hypothetical protein